MQPGRHTYDFCSTSLCAGLSLPMWLQASHFAYLCLAWGQYHLLTPTPTSQAGGASVAKAVRSPWPGPDSRTMRYPLCDLYSTFPKRGNVVGPSGEQWGSRRQHQRATSNMLRKNKIKQQSPLEQERLLKRALPGNVSSCFLTTLTRARHGAKQATPPAPGERAELQWGPNPFIFMLQ